MIALYEITIDCTNHSDESKLRRALSTVLDKKQWFEYDILSIRKLKVYKKDKSCSSNKVSIKLRLTFKDCMEDRINSFIQNDIVNIFNQVMISKNRRNTLNKTRKTQTTKKTKKRKQTKKSNTDCFIRRKQTRSIKKKDCRKRSKTLGATRKNQNTDCLMRTRRKHKGRFIKGEGCTERSGKRKPNRTDKTPIYIEKESNALRLLKMEDGWNSNHMSYPPHRKTKKSLPLLALV